MSLNTVFWKTGTWKTAALVGLGSALAAFGLPACGGGSDDADALAAGDDASAESPEGSEEEGTGETTENGGSETPSAGDCAFSEFDGQTVFGMEAIPAGPFWMGCVQEVDPNCLEDEVPDREVCLDAYLIDVREVSNEEFAQFLTDRGHNECAPGVVPDPEIDPYVETIVCADFDDEQSQVFPQGENWTTAPGKTTRPVSEVTWYGAEQYCAWADKRLCTEAEWEKAARGGCEFYDECRTGTPIYPWGNGDPTCEQVTMDGCGTGETEPVGQKAAGASPYDVYDMSGNVWEWTQDIYFDDFYSVGPSTNPTGADVGDFRIVRGGSYVSVAGDGLRSAFRGDFMFPYASASTVGFRCCKTPE